MKHILYINKNSLIISVTLRAQLFNFRVKHSFLYETSSFNWEHKGYLACAATYFNKYFLLFFFIYIAQINTGQQD